MAGITEKAIAERSGKRPESLMQNKTGQALSMRNIGIAFNGVQILNNVDFQLNAREVHGIVGANGAGKSTLMKIITGVYQMSTGEIQFFDQPVSDHFNPREAFESGIAMVYQDLSLVGSLTVAKNLFLSSQPYKNFGLIDDEREETKAAELLNTLGVGSISPSTPVDRLSVGECQIVEIAKALSRDPKILILDEPTASLSNIEIDVLFRAIEKLRESGISIIYITHYLQDILKICDRVTVLRNGNHIFTKDSKDSSIKELVEGMLGKEEKQYKWTKTVKGKDDTPLLQLNGISTTHIKDINMEVRHGEVVGLAGLLGSGRTEILRAIYGLDPLKTGKILVNGQEKKINSPQDAIPNGISMVPEERRSQGLVLDFSICNNMVIPILKKIATRGFLDLHKEIQIANEFRDKFQIVSTGSQQIVRFLSGGNQQKVVIAKCLVAQSRILLLDDPTFGIDVHSKMEIMELVRKYVAEGNSAIFVSSEFSEIASFCDRTYVVKKGQIACEFPDDNLNESQLLEAVQ